MNMRKIYRKVAKEYGVSVEEVKREMQAAITDAYTNPLNNNEIICKRIPVSICLWTFRPACKGVAPAWSGG